MPARYVHVQINQTAIQINVLSRHARIMESHSTPQARTERMHCRSRHAGQRFMNRIQTTCRHSLPGNLVCIGQVGAESVTTTPSPAIPTSAYTRVSQVRRHIRRTASEFVGCGPTGMRTSARRKISSLHVHGPSAGRYVMTCGLPRTELALAPKVLEMVALSARHATRATRS